MVLHSQRFATETLIRLSEKIPNVEIILEYSVKPYRVDAYLPNHNIAIEIDENDHSTYNPEKEFEHSRFITNTLHCSWIRVNNNDTIENTVGNLLKHLSYYGISSTMEAPSQATPVEPQEKPYTIRLKELKAAQAEEAARVEYERLMNKAVAKNSTYSDVFEVTNNPKDVLSYADIWHVFKHLEWDFNKYTIRQYLVKECHVENRHTRVNGHFARWYIGVKFKDPALNDLAIEQHNLLKR